MLGTTNAETGAVIDVKKESEVRAAQTTKILNNGGLRGSCAKAGSLVRLRERSRVRS